MTNFVRLNHIELIKIHLSCVNTRLLNPICTGHGKHFNLAHSYELQNIRSLRQIEFRRYLYFSVICMKLKIRKHTKQKKNKILE